MILGLCSIQRDRAPWIVEWLAFHYLVGVRKFYIYNHHCTDGTGAILARLAPVLDISAFDIPERMNFVQLKAYQHAYDTAGQQVDWMAFIDGDEFLFPTAADDLRDVLAGFDNARLSAVAAYWVCFGSNGHISEPEGLIVDNYTRRPALGFLKNRHVKSIVAGRQRVTVGPNAHLFATERGTVDEAMRPVTQGFMKDTVPSYAKLRINHYTCQSREYFTRFKKSSGMADAGHLAEREDHWWADRDINDHVDHEILRFRDKLGLLVDHLNAIVAGGSVPTELGTILEHSGLGRHVHTRTVGPVEPAEPAAPRR